MRIHGVRRIAVRMSPSRRCQTSWRARLTTADADVGIEGTDDALAEARDASATNISSRQVQEEKSICEFRNDVISKRKT